MKDFTKGALKALVWIAAIVAIVLAVLRWQFVDVITVGHNGMAPTIIAGDQVGLWRGVKIETGDVALCAHPGQAGRFVLARVIAREGQRLDDHRGQLLVNGERVLRDVVGQRRFHDIVLRFTDRYMMTIERFGNNTHPIFENERSPLVFRNQTVRRGLFLLGDNRGYRGEDSRTFGEVDESTCKGVVFIRLAPAPKPAVADPGDDLGHGWFDWIR
jgi:signal peptidase I